MDFGPHSRWAEGFQYTQMHLLKGAACPGSFPEQVGGDRPESLARSCPLVRDKGFCPGSLPRPPA